MGSNTNHPIPQQGNIGSTETYILYAYDKIQVCGNRNYEKD